MMVNSPVIDSATILTVRDGENSQYFNSLEVLMVKRHSNIEFAGGAYVFPGGKVDAQDLRSGNDIADGFSDFLYTAFRELFEETGLILGDIAKGCEQWEEDRKKIITGDLEFRGFIDKYSIKLNVNDITPFARWITPKIYNKRYDTRFYLAQAPKGQYASPDHGEVVECIWGKPIEFIDKYRKNMMFPTIMNLKMLSQASTVAQAFKQAKDRKIITVEPEIKDGIRYIDPRAGYGEIDQGNIHQGFKK